MLVTCIPTIDSIQCVCPVLGSYVAKLSLNAGTEALMRNRSNSFDPDGALIGMKCDACYVNTYNRLDFMRFPIISPCLNTIKRRLSVLEQKR